MLKRTVPLNRFWEGYLSIAQPKMTHYKPWAYYIPHDSERIRGILTDPVYIKDAHRSPCIFKIDSELKEATQPPKYLKYWLPAIGADLYIVAVPPQDLENYKGSYLLVGVESCRELFLVQHNYETSRARLVKAIPKEGISIFINKLNQIKNLKTASTHLFAEELNQLIERPRSVLSDSTSTYNPDLYIQALRDSDKYSFSDELRLTNDELKAVFAFVESAGETGAIQGGMVCGYADNLFKQWLMGGYKLRILSEFGSGSPYRVERSSATGQLKLSTDLQSNGLADIIEDPVDTVKITGASPTIPWISLYSDWQLEQKAGNFTLIPGKEELIIDETVWQQIIIPRAEKKLLKTELNAEDYYALIPCLCDAKFRSQFIQKLVSQPKTSYDLALKGLEIYYKGRPEAESEFLNELTMQSAAINKSRWIKATFAAAIIVGAVGIALTVTGIFAPLGALFGVMAAKIGLTAATVVVTVAGGLEGAVMGAVVIGLARGITRLAQFFSPKKEVSISPTQPEPATVARAPLPQVIKRRVSYDDRAHCHAKLFSSVLKKEPEVQAQPNAHPHKPRRKSIH